MQKSQFGHLEQWFHTG